MSGESVSTILMNVLPSAAAQMASVPFGRPTFLNTSRAWRVLSTPGANLLITTNFTFPPLLVPVAGRQCGIRPGTGPTCRPGYPTGLAQCQPRLSERHHPLIRGYGYELCCSYRQHSAWSPMLIGWYGSS